MSVLFSFVGGSDPIRGFHSGPLFSILREYESIDDVHILISDAFYNHKIEEKGNVSYIDNLKNAIEAHKKNLNRDFKVSMYKTDIKKANDFNEIYAWVFPFLQDKLNNYFSENENEEIFFNITSGTPQMSFTFLSIANMYSIHNLKFIQVDDFVANSKDSKDSISSNDLRNYSVTDELSIYNEFDLDDLKERKRCSIISLTALNFNSLIKKIELALNYNLYLPIKDLYKEELSRRSRIHALLNHIVYRQNGDFGKAKAELISKNIDYKKYMFYHNDNTREYPSKEAILEYYLKLQSSYKNYNYNDFLIRSINYSEFLVKKIIEKKMNVNTNKYERNNGNVIIDALYIDYPDFPDANMSKDNAKWNYTYYYKFLEYLDKDKIVDSKIMNFLSNMKSLVDLRNEAAHTLRDARIDEINKIYSTDIILNSFKKILIYLYDVKEEYFNIYDTINNDILNDLLFIKERRSD